MSNHLMGCGKEIELQIFKLESRFYKEMAVQFNLISITPLSQENVLYVL